MIIGNFHQSVSKDQFDSAVKKLRQEKDAAYLERNQLVAAKGDTSWVTNDDWETLINCYLLAQSSFYSSSGIEYKCRLNKNDIKMILEAMLKVAWKHDVPKLSLFKL